MAAQPLGFRSVLLLGLGLLLMQAICGANGPSTTGPDSTAPRVPASMPDEPDLSKGSASPKELLEKIHAALPGPDRILVSFLDPRYQRHGRETLAIRDRLVTRLNALAEVVTAKLGEKSAEGMRSAASYLADSAELPSPLGSAVVNGKIDWTKVRITQNGDQAEFSVAAGQKLYFCMVKVNGKWYVAWAEAGPQADNSLAEGCAAADKSIARMDEFEKKVKDGQITAANIQQEWASLQDDE